jgi:selenocysteine lyase/cysteine desulfurase
MPRYLPDRLEAGTVNVPGIAGLAAGLEMVRALGPEEIGKKERELAGEAARMLREEGMEVFAGAHQTGTVSFRPGTDCEEGAQALARQDIAVRAGLHCAPVAHESALTLDTGTIRLSFGYDSDKTQLIRLRQAVHTSFFLGNP